METTGCAATIAFCRLHRTLGFRGEDANPNAASFIGRYNLYEAAIRPSEIGFEVSLIS